MASRLSHFLVKKLSEEAMDVGKKLLQVLSSTAKITNILTEVEQILFMVQQYPSRLVTKALDQIITAMIAKELLIHPDVAVNISIACCICDVLTIMTPYNHEKMKDFFQPVVVTFEKLTSTSGGCYTMKVLETLSSVKFMELMSECLQLDRLTVRLFAQFISIAKFRMTLVIDDGTGSIQATISTLDVEIFIPFKNLVELKKVEVEMRLNPTYFSHTSFIIPN